VFLVFVTSQTLLAIVGGLDFRIGLCGAIEEKAVVPIFFDKNLRVLLAGRFRVKDTAATEQIIKVIIRYWTLR